MLRKLLAAVCTLLLAFGVTSIVGSAASAHTGDLNATAICQPDGTYLVTYTLKITNTKLAGTTKWRVGTGSFEGTPTSNAGLDLGPVASSGASTITLGTTTVAGNKTKAPWAYAYTTWSDGYSKGSDGGDITLAGNCKAQTTKVTPVAPTIVDECGTANDSVALPANTDAITYSLSQDGRYVYATLTGSNVKWGQTPSGWSASGDKLKYRLPAFNSDPCSHTETVCWLLDKYPGGDTNPDDAAEQSTMFPQTRIDCDDPVPCGMWVQKDVYVIDTAAKEEVWQGLGDTLDWVNGKPEDASIYQSHTFIYGGKCKPEQPQPLSGTDKRQTQECTVPADGTATVTDYEKSWTQGYVWNEDSWAWELGEKVYGDETSTTSTVADDDCTPPVIEVCTIGDIAYQQGDQLPAHYTWTSSGPCAYTDPICELGETGYWSVDELPEGVIYDEESGTCHEPVEPTLTATLVPMCIQNVPFLDYTATMNDPDDQAFQNDHVTFTFLNASGNGDGNWTSEELPLTETSAGVFTASGRIAWPFATYTGTLPGTITGTGWPGWTQNLEGDWEETEDGHNGGWTRDGVDVLAQVNPEYTIHSLAYPDTEFPCTPVITINKELDAPPAEPVEAEAQYAG